MRKLVSALVVVLAFSPITSSAAFAQKKGGGDSGQSKVKVYDFSGDTIEGDLIKPDGSDLNARDFAKHSSLIRIRTNFIPEIIKSAEDL